MFNRESTLHTEGVMYRCSKVHKQQLADLQKHIQATKHWGKTTITDVIQKAVNELHQSLIKPASVIKKVPEKKSIKKSKTIIK